MPETSQRDANQATLPLPTLCSVARMAELEPDLTKGAIRSDLFDRETNGLEESGAVVYRGRKILLHRERYLAWLVDGSRPCQPRSGRRAAA